MPELVLDNVLKNGLRPRNAGLVNSEYLVSARNVQCEVLGAQFHQGLGSFVGTPPAFDEWPFPQAFRIGESYWYLGKTTVQEAIAGAVTTYRSTDPTQALAPTAGETWHVASFQKIWFATNRVSTLMCLPHLDMDWKVCVGYHETPANVVSIRTLAGLRGRLYMGGFSSAAHFSGAMWTAIWNAWRTSHKQPSVTYENAVATDNNVVMISQHMGGDYEWPFFLEMTALGYHTAANSWNKVDGALLQCVEQGKIAFVVLPSEYLFRLLPLREYMIAYCYRGIYAITPDLEVITISDDLGAHGRGAAAGGPDFHYFMSLGGKLYVLTPDLQIHYLGYEEFLSNLYSTAGLVGFDGYCKDIVLSTTSPRRWLYAGTLYNRGEVDEEMRGYLLTREEDNKFALSEITYIPTSIVQENAIQTTGDDDVEIIIDTSDFLTRDFSTIHSIEVAGTEIPSLTVALGYKLDKSDADFTWTAAKALDSRGKAVFGVSAIEFQIKFVGTGITGLDLTRVKVILAEGEKFGLKEGLTA